MAWLLVVLARGRHRPKAAAMSEAATLRRPSPSPWSGASGGWVAWWTGRGIRVREDTQGLHVDTADQVVAMVRASWRRCAENMALQEQMVADAAACGERAGASR